MPKEGLAILLAILSLPDSARTWNVRTDWGARGNGRTDDSPAIQHGISAMTEGDTVVGRTSREAPEIDAIVRLPQKAVRNGRFVTARITGYDAYEFSATAE